VSALCTAPVDLGDNNAGMDQDIGTGLTDAQRAWALHSESLWRRAHDIAGAHPGIDPGDVYHALRCLELSPTERLRRGLSRGRLRANAR
jgi:hypothetical protein